MESNPKTAEDLVKERYPEAMAVRFVATAEAGQASPYQRFQWIVYAGPSQGDLVIGEGPTREAAWADALTHLGDVAAPNITIPRDPDELMP